MDGLRKAEQEHALLLQTALTLRTELTALQSRLAAFSASRTVTPTTPTSNSNLNEALACRGTIDCH